MKKFMCFLLALSFMACKPEKINSNAWRVVLKTATDGTVLEGSKQELIDAIRSGNDLKIGWGGKRENLSIEHLSTPIWLAILSEKEVMAHLDPQVLSSINWETLDTDYKDSTLMQKEWRVVLNTKGDFDAVWYDTKADTLIRRWPQKHPMTWFALGGSKINPPPLFK